MNYKNNVTFVCLLNSFIFKYAFKNEICLWETLENSPLEIELYAGIFHDMILFGEGSMVGMVGLVGQKKFTELRRATHKKLKAESHFLQYHDSITIYNFLHITRWQKHKKYQKQD